MKFKEYYPEFYGNNEFREYESLDKLFETIKLKENYSWKYEKGNKHLLIQERNDHATWWIVGTVDIDLSEYLEERDDTTN